MAKTHNGHILFQGRAFSWGFQGSMSCNVTTAHWFWRWCWNKTLRCLTSDVAGMSAPTRTIVCAALQQQSTFIQLTEFPHADEIVVHSGNFSFSRLPSGACKTMTVSDISRMLHSPLKGWVGEPEVTLYPSSPRGSHSIPDTAGPHPCVYSMNSRQRRDHGAMNLLIKCENTAAQRQEWSSVTGWSSWLWAGF